MIAEDPTQNKLIMHLMMSCFVFQYPMDSPHDTTGPRSYFPARSVLFRKEASGVTYRIPALIFLQPSSCFLAFCEERLSPADSQAHLLVMRKGVYYRNYVEVCKEEATISKTTFSLLCIHFSYMYTCYISFIHFLGLVGRHASPEHSLSKRPPFNEPVSCV